MTGPCIALTMGDAGGVGPELIVKVLADPETYELCRPVVVGDERVMREACSLLETDLRVRRIESVSEGVFGPDTLNLLQPPELHVPSLPPGTLDARLGEAAAECMRFAFHLAAQGDVGGVVLAPMNKAAFHLAGYGAVDELEYLAALTGSAEPFLLGAVSPALWTVAVTLHVPFKSIAGLITTQRVLLHIERLHDALRRVGIDAPRIAISGLNPHAGEGGLFGSEEIDAIEPAIAAARESGIDATGPWPGDTVFVRARDGAHDGVVSMYHDGANIARKLLATRSGATIYMGLPVVTGTTAHGTAFDIAGRGIADPGSLAAVTRYVRLLAGTAA